MPLQVKFVIEPGKQEVFSTCEFAAPRELVYRLYTDPALIPEWWGPAYLTTEVEVMDVYPGGRWRFIQRAPDGGVHPFNGVYHLVEAPRRLIYTFEYEGTPGQVILDTVTFEEKENKTLLNIHSVYPSVAERDGMVHESMESGAAEAMERLEKLILARM